LRRCFEFITREELVSASQQLPSATGELDALEEQILSQWLEEKEPTSGEDFATGEATHEDSVFLRSFIPRTLNEVYDPERDVAKLTKGQGDNLIYADTIGIVKPMSTFALNDENEGGQLAGGTAKQRTMAGSTAPITSTPPPKVRFTTSSDPEKDKSNQKDITLSTAEAKDMERDEGGSSEDEDKSGSEAEEASHEGSDNENEEHHKDGWVEKKPKGHRNEDREAKKVSSWLTSNCIAQGTFYLLLPSSIGFPACIHIFF
jgi:RIO kinase 1